MRLRTRKGVGEVHAQDGRAVGHLHPARDEEHEGILKGVVILGWGEGCGCSDAKVPEFLPFANGAYTVGGKAIGHVTVDRPSKK